MTTQTTQETAANEPETPPPSLDEIIAKVLLQLDQINEQIEDINSKLRSI